MKIYALKNIAAEVAEPSDQQLVNSALSPLEKINETSVNLVRKPLPTFQSSGREYYIPRYLFIGPKGGAEPLRVGLFAGVHGDEPEGSFALIDFIRSLDEVPAIAKNYCLFVYPIVNPSGFEARTRNTVEGFNITRELWKNSISNEVQQIQSELWMHGFEGIISLKSRPAAAEIMIEVGGPIFARHLFSKALFEAQDLLPQILNASADALPKLKNVVLDEPNELIRAAPGRGSRPFEIVITIPGQASQFLQRAAVSLILQKVLTEFRHFISYGANI